jgi:hypothetical protein
MAPLIFTGTDLRGLIDVLIAAVEFADREPRPEVIINGMIFAAGDLAKVAELLPEAELSPEHQAAVGAVFQKPPSSYRRAGAKLAVRANKIAAEAQWCREHATMAAKR